MRRDPDPAGANGNVVEVFEPQSNRGLISTEGVDTRNTMIMRRVTSNRPISILLAAVLLIAQTGALAHTYEHDPGSPQEQVCSTCIAGQAVGSACVDSTPHFEIKANESAAGPQKLSTVVSIHTPLARQRAPPTSL